MKLKFILSILSLSASITYAEEKKLPDYTLEDVAKHATPTDCWIVINDKVYDVTKYVAQHKKGIETYCGKDSTKIYAEIKDGKGHSNTALNMRKYFLVGNYPAGAGK